MSETAAAQEDFRRWVPLESNPEVLSHYIHELGVRGAEFVDVLGLDEELLAMIPTPVHALLLLYPITEDTERIRIEEDNTLSATFSNPPKNVFFVIQKVENACGTIGCIHSVCNSEDVKKTVKADSFFSKLLVGSVLLHNGEERARALDQVPGLDEAHEAAAQEGQTDAPDEDEAINLHFVAFVQVDGILYELDGRRGGPVPRGNTSKETFLKDAALAIKTNFIEKNPDEDRFTVLALVATEPQNQH